MITPKWTLKIVPGTGLGSVELFGEILYTQVKLMNFLL